MSAKLALGSKNAVETSVTFSHGEKESCVVEVEGTYAKVSNLNAATYCPAGYDVESSRVLSTGNSMGKLVINGIKYSANGLSTAPVRTTFRVDMMECQYDLKDHPYLSGSRDLILKWLATDEFKRVGNNAYYYEDGNGNLQPVTGNAAKFCAAYEAGIKSFMRYFPVVEKISVYKNPPGMTNNGGSFSGGSPTFSSGIGGYDTCPLTLNGFSSGGWYKSKDSWVENANRTWNRTEQWTWTPEGASSSHAWIYNEL